MPNPLIHAAEAAVVAHFATQLAGRLEERHFVEKTRAQCDQARRAIRILLAEDAPATARPEYRVEGGGAGAQVRTLDRSGARG